MALVIADRVKETTTTTGTGTLTLAGAVTGFQSFSVIGNGNTTYYAIAAGSQWEVGIGTYTSAGTTLARTTVLASSNANALVSFSAGTKEVFVTYPAGKSVNYDAAGNAGIGTSAPKTRLQATAGANLNAPVLGSATNAPFYLTNSDPSYGLLVGNNASDGHVWFQAQRTDGTATAFNITLNELGGNVGVGTNSPKTRLQVTASANLNAPVLGSATNAPFYMTNSDPAFGLVVGNSAADGRVWFQAQRTDGSALVYAITLNEAGGNVGIGTASPQALLDVNGDTIFRNTVYTEMVAPASKAAAATLTGAEVIAGYVQYTGAAATLTLPTATNLQTAMPSGVATLNDIAFQFTIINTGSGTATLAVNTGITAVGALTAAIGTSATFRIRKTATNTFIIYRT